MHIELIGCTSAGKTTLARKIVQAAPRMGLTAVLSDDFLLGKLGLNWIVNGFVRRRIIEALGLIACLVSLPRHRDFFSFAVRTSFRSPRSRLYRLHIARMTLRKIGIHEIIRRCGSDRQVIVADNEGVLQAAHTLFVHTAADSIGSDIVRFASLVPLPDVAVYIVQPEAVLVERILARGHNRIDDRTSGTVELFVRRAVRTFEDLRGEPAVASRLLVIDGEKNVVSTPETATDPLLIEAGKLIRAAIESAPRHRIPSPPHEGGSRAL